MAGRKAAILFNAEQLAEAANKSRAFRQQHNLTQQDLAYRLKCRVADISNIENLYRERSSRVVKAVLDLPDEHAEHLPADA